MVTPKHPQNALTLETKLKATNKFENGGITKMSLVVKHGIPKSTLIQEPSRKKQKKNKLRDSASFVTKRKRLRSANHEHLEQCSVMWLRRAWSENPPISGAIIFVLRLGIEDFA